MDLRIASDQARFSVRFVRMGLVPEASSSLYLPQIVGLANAFTDRHRLSLSTARAVLHEAKGELAK